MADSTSFAWVPMPLLTQLPGKKYSMIESGSKSVPWIWSTLVLVEHVVADRRLVPVVGRAGQALDHGRLVPLDAAGRVLVLVRETDRVAELVARRAAVHEAEIHRRLVQRNAAVVGADVRPGAVVRVECDADLGIRRVVEVELQVGEGRSTTWPAPSPWPAARRSRR